jgi:hypothetical protein
MNGDIGTVAPSQGFLLNLQMSETRIVFRLLQMYFLWNGEFGSALMKLRNFGGWFETQVSFGTPLIHVICRYKPLHIHNF